MMLTSKDYSTRKSSPWKSLLGDWTTRNGTSPNGMRRLARNEIAHFSRTLNASPWRPLRCWLASFVCCQPFGPLVQSITDEKRFIFASSAKNDPLRVLRDGKGDWDTTLPLLGLVSGLRPETRSTLEPWRSTSC